MSQLRLHKAVGAAIGRIKGIGEPTGRFRPREFEDRRCIYKSQLNEANGGRAVVFDRCKEKNAAR